VSLYCAEEGPQDKPTIVFLHGGGGAGWMWKPQVEALKGDYHLLIPDLPEQGRSTDGGPFTMPGAAEQVLALVMNRKGSGAVHLVGLSEGAQVVVELLAMEPSVATTAIVSSALVRPMPGASLMSSPSILKWSYRATIAPFRTNNWWIGLNMHSAAGVPDAYFEDFRESFSTLTENGFVNLMVANQAFRLPEGLGKVTARVLAVCGADEYKVMKLSTRDVADAIPAAIAREARPTDKLSVAEQHNWNMTAPDVFSSMVRAWIEETPLPAELVELVAR
jgi:pimeloyl-ACP methyl ester carboxylesterase